MDTYICGYVSCMYVWLSTYVDIFEIEIVGMLVPKFIYI